MEEGLDGIKQRGFKLLIIFLVFVFAAVILYFAIAARFTPSWVLGEALEGSKPAIEIEEADLVAHRNLAKFITNMVRNTGSGEKGVQVLVKGTNGEGSRLKNFLSARAPASSPLYPYIVKYKDKYYGLDIIFQFKSPWVLGTIKDE